MTMFLVSYDLIGPNRDYDAIFEHLKGYGTWARPLESVWIIKTDKTAKDVKLALREVTDANDKIVVLKLDPGTWSTYNIADSTTKWMHKHL